MELLCVGWRKCVPVSVDMRGGGGLMCIQNFCVSFIENSTTIRKRKKQKGYDMRKNDCVCVGKCGRYRKTQKKLKVTPNVPLPYGGLKEKGKNYKIWRTSKWVCWKIKGIEKRREGSLGARESLEKSGKGK